MAREPYDPLKMIPSPEAVRERLEETLALAERLRVLLDLSERLHRPPCVRPAAKPPGKKGD